MKPTTLCLVRNAQGDVLLGMKKRGFGAGKYNGFGGKIQEGESFRACAVREVLEECSLLVVPDALHCVGWLDFQFPYSPETSHICYVYTTNQYEGIPLESEEMKPYWFAPSEIPYDEMWDGDADWMPRVLKGKRIRGTLVFAADGESVASMNVEEVDEVIEE